MPGVSAIYFAARIDAGAGAKIEDALTRALSTNWDQTLLVLFGSVQTVDVDRQLEMADQWLSLYSRDAVLLSVLGKLSLKCSDSQKAESYLSKTRQS